MPIAIFDHRRMRQAIGLVLLSGTFFCIFPVHHPLSLAWASHSVFVCLGYLTLGIVFFITNRKRLMFVAMGCCAAICLYYLEIAPRQLPPNNQKIPQNATQDSLQELNRPRL